MKHNYLNGLNFFCVGIRLHVRGEGFVHWTDQRMRGPAPLRTPARHHSAHEEYFDLTTTVLESHGNFNEISFKKNIKLVNIVGWLIEC